MDGNRSEGSAEEGRKGGGISRPFRVQAGFPGGGNHKCSRVCKTAKFKVSHAGVEKLEQ
jgi:hypothetical protein